jgi:hypothetical protein
MQPTVAAFLDTVGTPAVTIQLQYDGQSLTILNTSGDNVDLSRLRLESERGTLGAQDWNNGFLTADLAAFPARDCLQAWTLDVVDPPPPQACDTRHAWIALTDARVMWMDVSQFTVYMGDVQIGTCAVAVGRCDVQMR